MPVVLRVDGDAYTTVYESRDDLDDNLQSARDGSIAINFTAINGEPVPNQGELILRPMALASYAMWEIDDPRRE
jgi:hypothetical protein